MRARRSGRRRTARRRGRSAAPGWDAARRAAATSSCRDVAAVISDCGWFSRIRINSRAAYPDAPTIATPVSSSRYASSQDRSPVTASSPSPALREVPPKAPPDSHESPRDDRDRRPLGDVARVVVQPKRPAARSGSRRCTASRPGCDSRAEGRQDLAGHDRPVRPGRSSAPSTAGRRAARRSPSPARRPRPGSSIPRAVRDSAASGSARSRIARMSRGSPVQSSSAIDSADRVKGDEPGPDWPARRAPDRERARPWPHARRPTMRRRASRPAPGRRSSREVSASRRSDLVSAVLDRIEDPQSASRSRASAASTAARTRGHAHRPLRQRGQTPDGRQVERPIGRDRRLPDRASAGS